MNGCVGCRPCAVSVVALEAERMEGRRPDLPTHSSAQANKQTNKQTRGFRFSSLAVHFNAQRYPADVFAPGFPLPPSPPFSERCTSRAGAAPLQCTYRMAAVSPFCSTAALSHGAWCVFARNDAIAALPILRTSHTCTAKARAPLRHGAARLVLTYHTAANACMRTCGRVDAAMCAHERGSSHVVLCGNMLH